MTRDQVVLWLGEQIDRMEREGVRVERVLLLLPDGETVSWHRPVRERERRETQEVNTNLLREIPHAGKCSACGQPAHITRYAYAADGSVGPVYAARRWFGALYPACELHADPGALLPGQPVRPS